MFVDDVAMMLINLVIALVAVAVYALMKPADAARRMAPAFLATGFGLTAVGLHMMFVWPLPSSYNIAFGSPAVLFGVLLFLAGLGGLLSWDFLSLGIYAVFSGLAAIVVGIRIGVLGMTNSPAMATAGFVLTGVGGLLALPLYFFRGNRGLRILIVVIVLLAALVWAVIGYGAFWQHLADFAKWAPPK
jgi:putative membrane protein